MYFFFKKEGLIGILVELKYYKKNENENKDKNKQIK